MSVALAVVAIGIGAVPAQAAPDTGSVTARLENVVIGVAGAPGKVLPLLVTSTAKDAKVVLDVSGLAGVAIVDVLHTGCTADGTCALPDAGFSGAIRLRFRPAATAKQGDLGTIVYTSSAAGVAAERRAATVTVADGPDLVVRSGGESTPAKLGDKVTFPVTFENVGSRNGTGIKLTLRLSHGLVADEYQQCVAATWSDAHGQVVECTFQMAVERAKFYEFVGGFGATVGPTARGRESVDYTVEPLGSTPAAAPDQAFAARDRVQAAAVDIDANDNAGEAFVTGITNTFDVAAIGATVSGAAGSTVTAKVGMKNLGAAALDAFGGEQPKIQFVFTVPAGADVLTVPGGCAATGPDKRVYVCDHTAAFLGAGESFLVEFGLRVTSAGGGTVSVDLAGRDPVVYPDDLATNNTAAVTVTIPSERGGGSLPITGRSTGWFAGIGALLVALGAVLLYATRRRA